MSTHGFPYRLVVLRHGQSEWNAAGVFTGWENARLTARGELEATHAGALLAEHGVLPAFAHTSLQRRTIRTADLVLAAADREWIPVRRSWRLNGRHYGALQGRDKAEVFQQYGEQQVTLWRRSYDVPPPPLDAEALSSQAADPRYQALPPAVRPGRSVPRPARRPPRRRGPSRPGPGQILRRFTMKNKQSHEQRRIVVGWMASSRPRPPCAGPSTRRN